MLGAVRAGGGEPGVGLAATPGTKAEMEAHLETAARPELEQQQRPLQTAPVAPRRQPGEETFDGARETLRVCEPRRQGPAPPGGAELGDEGVEGELSLAPGETDRRREDRGESREEEERVANQTGRRAYTLRDGREPLPRATVPNPARRLDATI